MESNGLQLVIDKLTDIKDADVFNKQAKDDVIANFKELENRLSVRPTWESFSTFWPPRLIKAFAEENMICFFGAGISQACGLPSWDSLLNNYFELDKVYTTDKDLENDPLTLGEIASHYIGSEKVQLIIRTSFEPFKTPSVSHYTLCSLGLRYYITTNYDTLFERAWEKLNGNVELIKICNTSDLKKHLVNGDLPNLPNRSYLFKIHGCAERMDEQIILTRSEYRHHYRSNMEFFKFVEQKLLQMHVLFLGFSHRDPEVTRLVEDVIWEYEKNRDEYTKKGIRPNYYSLQFNMKSHTPEIFAAKGIVALNPPIVSFDARDVRTEALCIAIGDLIGAVEKQFHNCSSIDELLKNCITPINDELEKGLSIIENKLDFAKKSIMDKTLSRQWMHDLLGELGPLGSQGLYLLDENGMVIDLEVQPGLNIKERKEYMAGKRIGLRERPYFRQAKTYRKAFVSDSIESIFNKNSTFFLCVPILNDGHFFGLLFSACQIGNWALPIECAKTIWNNKLIFTLIDSNGICLLPPKNEIPAEKNKGLHDNEEENSNFGYPYMELVSLSRKDRLVTRIMKNVIPIDQDDDVLSLLNDLKYYSIISELKITKWKMGISCPIFLSKK